MMNMLKNVVFYLVLLVGLVLNGFQAAIMFGYHDIPVIYFQIMGGSYLVFFYLTSALTTTAILVFIIDKISGIMYKNKNIGGRYD